jgi:hypothetical protein
MMLSDLVSPRLHLLEQFCEVHAPCGAHDFGAFFRFEALFYDGAGARFAFDTLGTVACDGHIVQTHHLNGGCRRRAVDLFPRVVEHRADFAPSFAHDQDVAALERALLHQDGCHGTAPFVQLRLDNCALKFGFWIRLQFRQLRHKQNHLQQGIYALTRDGGNRHTNRVAAPRFRHQLVLGELLHHAVGVRLRLVNLIDGDDDGYLRVLA